MALKSVSLVFLILSLISIIKVSAEVSNGGRKALIGGWKDIKDLKDPKVVEIAKFAVDEYNKKQSAAASTLTFVSVVKGQMQVVDGIRYKLVIAATASGSAASHNYQAVVYSEAQPTAGSKLISFTPVSA